MTMTLNYYIIVNEIFVYNCSHRITLAIMN